MEYVLIIGNDVDFSEINIRGKYIIGVDKGAYQAITYGIVPHIAIGDFDSIKADELALIESKTKVIYLNPVKDDTDTAAALKLCKDASRIIIWGGIQGKRIEHFLGNLNLMLHNNHIELMDRHSHMYIKDTSFTIQRSKYQYFSFFAVEDSIITLEGFKYPLKDYFLKKEEDTTLTLSNELSEQEGKVSIQCGRLLVIESKEDR